MKFVVDTHALIWFLVGSSRLGVDALAALSDPSSELIVPGIVLAEACWLVEHRKTPIPSVTALLQSLDDDPRFSVFPSIEPWFREVRRLRLLARCTTG